jgi:hypothetical protein
VNARGSVWEAPGCAQGPEEGTVARPGAGELGGARGGSGDGGATWRGEERASARWEAAAHGLGRHVAQGKAAWGRWVRSTWPARAAGSDVSRNRGGEGLEVKDKGGSVIFQKYRDSTIKPR